MQSPGLQDVLKEVAECASRYSINLDGRVRRDPAIQFRSQCATVYKGILESQDMMVAVKTVIIPGDLQQLDTYKRDIKKALQEVHTWSKLSHPNVLPLLGITTDFDHTISMVSEWMDNANAHRYVQNPEVDPRPLLHDIAQGLHYLHTYEPGAIFHGDLKGQNVLISPEGRALLTDFGFSRVINSSFGMTRPPSGVGTLRWMAPEILDGGEISGASDVWAFGMTCLELFTRTDPFPKCQTILAVTCAIVKGPDRPSLEVTHSRLTDCWWSLCSSCWKLDQKSRRSISDVVNRISYILDPKLEIYGIEVQDAKKVKSIELNISGRPHTVPRERDGAVFRAEFSPPLRPGPEEFSLSIAYKKSGRHPIFDPFDVYSNSKDHKFCKEIEKINIDLTLSQTSSTPGNEFLSELGQSPRARSLGNRKSGVPPSGRTPSPTMPPASRLQIFRIELICRERVDFAMLIIDDQSHYLSKHSNGDILYADFDPALETASQQPFLLVTYLKQDSSSSRRPHKMQFKPSDVLAKSRNDEFRHEDKNFDIVFKLSVASSEATSVPVHRSSLYTTEALQQCPRFRLLVIGKSGVGKSTLINLTFGIKSAFPEHDKRGRADITQGLISKQNDRFILHDSKGFESGEDDTLTVVTKFIKERRNNEDIKEQLHAVWLCFQIPNTEAGQRMMETGMEEFLQQKKETLGDVPTIFVFTKYDVLTTAVEDALMESVEDYTPADVESKAKQLVEERCVEPIKKLTKETSIPHIAVSMKHRDKLGELMQLTCEQVSEYFGNRPGVGALTVPTSLLMAQRVAPHLNPQSLNIIERSIRAGKEKYWQAIFAGAVFTGHSMQDCLRVIHDDIIGLWNFRDEDKLLQSKEFREFMMNLVDLLDRPIDCPPPLQRSEMMSSMQEGFPLFLMFALPFVAGLGLVQWVHKVYQKTPEVQRNFIAYIVDLTNVLDILFTLTASRSEEILNIRAIKAAYKAYYGSMRRMDVHAQIRGRSLSIFRSGGVISAIETLVRQRYVIDEELTKRIGEVSAKYLEGEESWYP